MKIIDRLIVFSILSVVAIPALSTEPVQPERSAAYRACARSSGGRMAALSLCAADEARRADRALNTGYKRTMASLGSTERQHLRRSEQQWIAARDDRCKRRYRDEQPGQQAGALYQLCMADTAASRLAVLKAGRWR